MIVLLMQLIPEILWFVIVLVLGSVAGASLFMLEEGFIPIDSFNPEYIPIVLFMLFVGMIFQHMAHKAIRDINHYGLKVHSFNYDTLRALKLLKQ